MSYKTISDLKASARGHLQGCYSQGALIILVYILLSSFSLLWSSTTTSKPSIALTIITVVLSILLTTIPYLLKAGLYHFFMKICCNAPRNISDVCDAFKIQFKRNFAFALFMIVLENICLLPGSFLLAQYIDQKYPLSYAVIALICGLITCLYIDISFSQVFFLMFDFPEKRMTELLQLSLYLMKGQKLRFFIMSISFIPLQLISYLCCGVGLLWVLPYKYSTYACFYLELTKKYSDK